MNRSRFTSAGLAPRIDWALIALFYGGMHDGEAYLARTNVPLRSHAARDYVVNREAVLKCALREYQDSTIFYEPTQ